jgi:hypothetical protein
MKKVLFGGKFSKAADEKKAIIGILKENEGRGAIGELSGWQGTARE